MTTILFSHADWIITAADCGQRSSITPVAGVRQIRDGAILVRDGWIEAFLRAIGLPENEIVRWRAARSSSEGSSDG